ncbi:MAG: type II secretion system F family protein [bacterium]
MSNLILIVIRNLSIGLQLFFIYLILRWEHRWIIQKRLNLPEFTSVIKAGLPLTDALGFLVNDLWGIFPKWIKGLKKRLEKSHNPEVVFGRYKRYLGEALANILAHNYDNPALPQLLSNYHSYNQLPLSQDQDIIRSDFFMISFFTIEFLVISMYINFSMWFIIPKIKQIYRESNLPFMTNFFILITDFIYRNGIIIFPLVSWGIFFIILGYWLTKRSQLMFIIYSYLPLVGRISQERFFYLFWSNLYAFITAGIPLTDSLVSTGQASNNPMIERLCSIMAKKISDGQRLGGVIRDMDIFPEWISEILVYAEEKGIFEQTVNEIAQRYKENFLQRKEKIMRRIEPSFTLGLGVIVAVFALAMYSSISGLGWIVLKAVG